MKGMSNFWRYFEVWQWCEFRQKGSTENCTFDITETTEKHSKKKTNSTINGRTKFGDGKDAKFHFLATDINKRTKSRRTTTNDNTRHCFAIAARQLDWSDRWLWYRWAIWNVRKHSLTLFNPIVLDDPITPQPNSTVLDLDTLRTIAT